MLWLVNKEDYFGFVLKLKNWNSITHLQPYFFPPFGPKVVFFLTCPCFYLLFFFIHLWVGGWLSSWMWLRAWQELSCVTHALWGSTSPLLYIITAPLSRTRELLKLTPSRIPYCHSLDPVFLTGRSEFHCTSLFHLHPHAQRRHKCIFKLDAQATGLKSLTYFCKHFSEVFRGFICLVLKG